MAQVQVQKGDTLWSLAQKLLGSGARWGEFGYTGDPKKLRIGTTLNVPESYGMPVMGQQRGIPKNIQSTIPTPQTMARTLSDQKMPQYQSAMTQRKLIGEEPMMASFQKMF